MNMAGDGSRCSTWTSIDWRTGSKLSQPDWTNISPNLTGSLSWSGSTGGFPMNIRRRAESLAAPASKRSVKLNAALSMKILALEFSADVRRVAIADEQNGLAYAMETGGRETRAFALIESALRESKVAREQIDCIAVGVGPGSYTGIRQAIAI